MWFSQRSYKEEKKKKKKKCMLHLYLMAFISSFQYHFIVWCALFSFVTQLSVVFLPMLQLWSHDPRYLSWSSNSISGLQEKSFTLRYHKHFVGVLDDTCRTVCNTRSFFSLSFLPSLFPSSLAICYITNLGEAFFFKTVH